MNDYGSFERLAPWGGIFLIFALLPIAGCAAGGPQRPPELIGKIESARTAKDHEQLAAIYERQSTLDQAEAERHQARAQRYRALRSSRTSGTYLAMAQHCESLASQYRQAAQENSALATLHRQMAAEAGN